MTSPQITAIISLIPSLETSEMGLLIAWLSSISGFVLPNSTSHIFDAIISLCKTIDEKQIEQILLVCLDRLKIALGGSTTLSLSGGMNSCTCKHKDVTFGTYS